MKKLNFLSIFIVIFFCAFFTNLSAYASIGKSNLPVNKSRENTISIRSEVNPGMELIAIMLWLSNNYPTPMDSPYKLEVWKHFSKFRRHPSILKMKERQFYTDFTEVGLLMTDFPEIKISFPENNSWYKTLGSKENAVSVMNGAKSFAKDTNFWKFHQAHQRDYANWTSGFAGEVEEKKLVETVKNFFRYADNRQSPQVMIYLEPLNNWGAHAINFERLNGEPNNSRVTFQIGPSAENPFFDSPVVFKIGNDRINTIWHEATHVYLSQTIKENEKTIQELEKLFDPTDKNLIRQNIKTWSYAFEENLIRGIVAALMKERFGDEAYKNEINGLTKNGFIYSGAIADSISTKYLANSSKYSNFDDFMPEIFALLKAKLNSREK